MNVLVYILCITVYYCLTVVTGPSKKFEYNVAPDKPKLSKSIIFMKLAKILCNRIAFLSSYPSDAPSLLSLLLLLLLLFFIISLVSCIKWSRWCCQVLAVALHLKEEMLLMKPRPSQLVLSEVCSEDMYTAITADLTAMDCQAAFIVQHYPTIILWTFDCARLLP